MTKSEHATTLTLITEWQAAAGRLLCFLEEAAFVSETKSEKVLVPEPLSCLGALSAAYVVPLTGQ